MSTLRGFVAITFLVGAGTVHNTQWKRFENTRLRYEISYPASWHLFTNPLAPNPETLDILNFPPAQRVQGVVLKPQGAEITVSRAPAGVNTIDEWIKAADSKSYVRIRREEIRNFRRNSGCVRLVRVTSKWDAESSERQQVITDTYCLTSRALYDVRLVNWADDPGQSNLQEIALRMALSFRFY